MPEAGRQAVARTFLEVAEQLAFMFGAPADKGRLPLAGTPLSGAAVAFTGDRNGSLALVLPAAAAAEIAANILGLEPGATEAAAAAQDALAELVNVVCGHVVGALAGSGADFRLQPPRSAPVTPDLLEAMLESDDWLGFLLEDRPLLLGLTLLD